MSDPRVVGPSDREAIQRALADGQVVALPAAGSYWLAVRVGDTAAAERLGALATAITATVTDAATGEEPHFLVGHRNQAHGLAADWTEATDQLMVRCWPGPLTVILPVPDDVSSTGTARFSIAPTRPLRRLLLDAGPWRTRPLEGVVNPDAVAARFDPADVGLIIDGGPVGGPGPTLVDATVTPARVVHEGALPAPFVQAAQIMGGRRRLWSGRRRGNLPGSPGPG